MAFQPLTPRKRVPADHCDCGRKAVDCIDNFGQPYRGCPTCRIMSLDEINTILVAGGEDPIR